MTLAFIDTETTGLDPDLHEIWEVALFLRTPKDAANGDRWSERRVWQLPVDLGRADPVALRIGRFHERRWPYPAVTELGEFARVFALYTRGAHLVGNVISFDEERLRRLLRSHGACPEWHYHLVDVEALVAGKLGIAPPWTSKDLSEAIGVEVPDIEDAHTAAGDASWAMDLYDAVMTSEVNP